jgi:transketolase
MNAFRPLYIPCATSFKYEESARRAASSALLTNPTSVRTGGLGSATAEVIAETGTGKKLIRMGLPDVFAHGASRTYLMKKYGLDAMALVRSVESLLGAQFNIHEEELTKVHLTPVHSESKIEAL